MVDEGAREKWDRRYAQVPADSPAPAQVLSEYAYLLPESGTALDLGVWSRGQCTFSGTKGLQGARLGYLEGRHRGAGPSGKIRRAWR